MNNQYEYVEKPLTPGIAEKLIQELFAGQTVQKQEIMRIIKKRIRNGVGCPHVLNLTTLSRLHCTT